MLTFIIFLLVVIGCLTASNEEHRRTMAEHNLNTKIKCFIEQCNNASYSDIESLYAEADKIIIYARRNTTKADKTARKLYNILSAWELNLNQIQLA